MEIKNSEFISKINTQQNLSIILFILITVIATFFVFTSENYLYPLKKLLIFGYVIVDGVISLIYYFKTKNLHKTAVIIILLFGILFVVISPINSISDEKEHLYRAEITSQGVLIPEYIEQGNESGFISIASLLDSPKHTSIYDTDWDSEKINKTR